jgi:hypothetical protein
MSQKQICTRRPSKLHQNSFCQLNFFNLYETCQGLLDFLKLYLETVGKSSKVMTLNPIFSLASDLRERHVQDHAGSGNRCDRPNQGSRSRS